MSAASSNNKYDASVELDRKLTQDETRELRILLVPYFHDINDNATNDENHAPETINEFLDYAFAMVNNHKSVDYVIKELVGMEMEFCNTTVAEKVGGELSAFLQKAMKGEEETKEEGDNANEDSGGAIGGGSDGKDGKIASLKVGCCVVI